MCATARPLPSLESACVSTARPVLVCATARPLPSARPSHHSVQTPLRPRALMNMLPPARLLSITTLPPSSPGPCPPNPARVRGPLSPSLSASALSSPPPGQRAHPSRFPGPSLGLGHRAPVRGLSLSTEPPAEGPLSLHRTPGRGPSPSLGLGGHRAPVRGPCFRP